MLCAPKKVPNIFPVIALSALSLCANESRAEERSPNHERPYALSIYGGRMTSNNVDDFVDSLEKIDFERSFLLTIALSRTLARYRDLASLEVEGQVVRHFNRQNHWEFNALIAARWEKFYWDDKLDTSIAIGTGPSYAARRPQVEEQNNDQTDHLLAYMLIELEFVLPKHPNTSFITRIHHRSNAWGLVADNGGSNALAFGLKYRF
ncbi:acyloxyacyl hydrolase [Verrucomicrobiota bacterium]